MCKTCGLNQQFTLVSRQSKASRQNLRSTRRGAIYPLRCGTRTGDKACKQEHPLQYVLLGVYSGPLSFGFCARQHEGGALILQSCPTRARVQPACVGGGRICFTAFHRPRSAAGAAASVGPTLDHRQLTSYPPIDLDFPGLEVVHSEPPVFVCHSLLSAEECTQLISAAESGLLKEIAYDNAMLMDTQRLWPLAGVTVAGAGFDTWQQLQHSLSTLDGASPGTLMAASLASLGKWGLIIGALVAGVQALMPVVLGKVFTGTKWAARGSGAATGHPAAALAAAAALRRFVAQVSHLSLADPTRLELPTVTGYQTGQYQRAHYDGRPAGDPQGLQEFMQAGGQRLMQVVVYLNTLTPEQQGGTHFHHPLLGGLTVQPRCGDALVFFPAFADGTLDHRMKHSGLAVKDGEKWICNTWVCQSSLPPGCSAASGLPEEASY